MHIITFKNNGEELFFEKTSEFFNYLRLYKMNGLDFNNIDYYVDPNMVKDDDEYFSILCMKYSGNIPLSCKNRYDYEELCSAANVIMEISKKFPF